MFSEGVKLVDFDLDPDVDHISKPMTRSCSLEVVQDSVIRLHLVQVHYNRYTMTRLTENLQYST